MRVVQVHLARGVAEELVGPRVEEELRRGHHHGAHALVRLHERPDHARHVDVLGGVRRRVGAQEVEQLVLGRPAGPVVTEQQRNTPRVSSSVRRITLETMSVPS